MTAPSPSTRSDLTAEDFPSTPARDGRVAWIPGLLGLLLLADFLGVHTVSALPMSVAMIIVGLIQHRENPVARRTGRNAAIFGLAVLVPVVILIAAYRVIPILDARDLASFDTLDSVGALMFPLAIWEFFIAPLVGAIMGIVALVRPVSRQKAARILATSGH